MSAESLLDLAGLAAAVQGPMSQNHRRDMPMSDNHTAVADHEIRLRGLRRNSKAKSET